jgi:hypothetical protein
MTEDNKNIRLPGSRLYQFSAKYFEQPALEKIARPIIADLQHEYSIKSQTSISCLLVLLRGYLGFWKAIGLYSLFSKEGNIRPFKSIGFIVFLGSAIGAVFSLLSWKGNQTAGGVMLFVNGFTMLIFFCLLWLAVWFCSRQLQSHRFLDIWRIARTISITTGVILGTTIIFLSYRQFHPFSVLQLSIVGFLLTLALVLVFGLIASLLVRLLFAFRKS